VTYSCEDWDISNKCRINISEFIKNTALAVVVLVVAIEVVMLVVIVVVLVAEQALI
jgi:hypothetical protein